MEVTQKQINLIRSVAIGIIKEMPSRLIWEDTEREVDPTDRAAIAYIDAIGKVLHLDFEINTKRKK